MKIKDLESIIYKIFRKKGFNNDHSRICKNALINAELVGAQSHGVSRLKMYCDRINAKLINPNPKIKIKKISSAISKIDADNAIGFVAADIGMKQAIKSGLKTGIGLVGICKSGHYGLSGYYAEKAVKKNLIVFCYTNAPPAIAPHGAKKTLFGTNPICFGSPSGTNIPFILDTSVSVLNRGKIRLAAKIGKKIPSGVALDKFGKPTIDPIKALSGVQLPIGGYRGSGLAWMVDILSGVMTGGNHGGKVKDPFDDFSGPQNIGHLFIVIKKNIFVNNFDIRMKKNIARIKRLPRTNKKKEILFPGQNRYLKMKRNNKKNFIKIPKKIKSELYKLLNE